MKRGGLKDTLLFLSLKCFCIKWAIETTTGHTITKIPLVLVWAEDCLLQPIMRKSKSTSNKKYTWHDMHMSCAENLNRQMDTGITQHGRILRYATGSKVIYQWHMSYTLQIPERNWWRKFCIAHCIMYDGTCIYLPLLHIWISMTNILHHQYKYTRRLPWS